jgi:LysR family hydrogen peroxide-inducible transcriptional activator
MTLTELRYIVALAREKHFGRAAAKCFVAQPTLSVAVKRLENELQVALFERMPNEVRLTEIGARVVAQAEKVLAEILQLTEIAQSCSNPLVGALRIGVIYTIAPWLLPRLVPLVKKEAPSMPLLLAEDFTHRLLERVKLAELDIAILALPVAESGLVAQGVYDEQFRTLVPAEHPWAKKSQIAPKALEGEPLLMLGVGNCFRDQVLDLCSLAGQGGPQVLEGSGLETIRHMVASGVGVSVMPASAVDSIARNDPLLRVIPFSDPQPTRRVGLVWRASFPRHAAVEVIRQALLNARLPGTTPVKLR